MLEVVYSGKETNEVKEVRIPKNIRQVGVAEGSKKIYIEDYVMNSIKKLPDKEDSVKYGVLLGEVKRTKDATYVFARGMVEIRDVIENSVIFNDDIWAGLYKDIKSYFEGLEIVGWFVSLPYTVKNEMSSLQKIHLDNFAGNDKVCFLCDRTENEDGFFRYEDGNLKKEKGYYIFYEKNERMKKYLKMTQGNRWTSSKEEVSSGQTDDKPEMKRIGLREMLKNQLDEEVKKPMKFSKMSYGISSILIIALLLSTIVMLNNYGELKKLKASIETFNSDSNVQAVNEILSSIMPTTQSAENVSATQENETTEGIIDGEETEISSQEEPAEISNDTTEVQIETQDEEVTLAQDDYYSDDVQTNYPASSIYSGTYHKVETGQTLYDISIEYYGDSGMVEAIKEINGIDDDYLIKEGETLLLP